MFRGKVFKSVTLRYFSFNFDKCLDKKFKVCGEVRKIYTMYRKGLGFREEGAQAVLLLCHRHTYLKVCVRYTGGRTKLPRVKTSITMDKKFLEWIQKKIEERIFASKSHAIEYAIKKLMDQEREKGD